MKYVACALIIQYWQVFFTDVANGFSAVATHISATDFMSSLSQTYYSNGGATPSWSISFLGMAIIPLMISALWAVVGVCYYVFMIVFSVIYTAWGLILFAIGPLLIALLPSNATSSFAKHYMKSLAEWAAWPILYSIMAVLAGSMTILTSPVTSQNIQTSAPYAASWNLIQGIVIAVVYLVFMLALPFIASHLISGDFGKTAMGAIKAALVVAGAPAAAAGGIQAAGKAAGKAAGALGGGGGGSSTDGSTSSHSSGSGSSGGSGSGASSPPPASPEQGNSRSVTHYRPKGFKS